MPAWATGGFAFRVEGDAPERFFPMTPAQLRVFAVMERPGAGLLNHLTAAYVVKDDFDAERMEDAVADVIARHEALRTSLHLIDGEPVQKVWPEPPFRFERYSGLSLAEFAERFVRPFDLACPPLLRAAVARLGDGRRLLAFDLHHAVADGMSLDIIAREVAENYAGSGAATAPARQYREFHADIAGTRRPDVTEKLSASWREELSTQPPELRLPKPCPADDVDDADASDVFTVSGASSASPFAGGKVFARWSGERTALARALAKRHGVTPFMLHAAILGLALRRLTGCADFYVGTAAGARPAGAEETVGMFVNTLPLRISPAPDISLGKYMRSVRQNCLAAFARQDCPFEIIAGHAPDQSRPLFTVMLPYERATSERTKSRPGPCRDARGHPRGRFVLRP